MLIIHRVASRWSRSAAVTSESDYRLPQDHLSPLPRDHCAGSTLHQEIQLDGMSTAVYRRLNGEDYRLFITTRTRSHTGVVGKSDQTSQLFQNCGRVTVQ